MQKSWSTKRRLTAPNGDQTIYEGAFEYKASGPLSRIGLEEGQLLRDAQGNYSVQYYMKDHLGNVRMVLREDGSVLQRTEYYAFGLPFFKDTSSVNTNKYLYNGKEQQPQTRWLDYGARMYNPGLGRWMTIDPLAEVSRRWSPYNYGYNNPLRFIDSDGREGRDAFGNVTFNGFADIGAGGYIAGSLQTDAQQGNDSDSGTDKTGQSGEVQADADIANTSQSSAIQAQGDPPGGKKANPSNSQSNSLGETAGNINDYVVAGATTVWGTETSYLGNYTNLKSLGDNISNWTGIGVGAQSQGYQALRQTGTVLKFVSSKAGALGYGLALYSYGSQVLDNPSKITTATHVNFGISTILYGGAAIATAVGAPIVVTAIGTAALIYGTAQLGSQIFTHKTLEQHFFDKK